MKNAVEMYEGVPIWIPDLRHLLDPNYKDIGDPSMDELIETLKFYDDSCKAEKQKLAHSSNKTYQKNKLTKAAEQAQLARVSLLKIRGGLTPICNIVNTPSFIESFFNQKHQQDYYRLNPLMKLLIAQHMLHNQQDSMLTSYPFTFLLPEKFHGVNVSILNRKIQRRLFPILKSNASMWTTAEYFGNGYRKLDKRITHINGEILLPPADLPAVKRAFVQIFRSAEKRKRNQTQLTDGTISTKPVPSYVIIKFPIQSRNLNTHLCGKFYATYNWASYSFKQDDERALDYRRTRFDCQLQRKPLPALNKEKFHYISEDLNKLAAEFYNANIRK
jgi:hypothetical protein